MLLHPLLTKALSQPGLFVEHAGAYAELASVEVREAAVRLRRRAIGLALASALGLIGLALAGAALLLCAALPLQDMPMPWLLAVVPAVFLAAAGLCAALSGSGSEAGLFSSLHEQMAADARLIEEAARS